MPWQPIETAPKNGWVLLDDGYETWWPATWTEDGWSHSAADFIPPEFDPARWHEMDMLPAGDRPTR